MNYSYSRYIGDGTTTDYAINFVLGFLKREDVHVYVDGVETPFTWVNDGLITVSPAPAADALVLIRRIVDKTTLQHDYEDGAVVIEKNLDESNMQSIMAVHEMIDGFIDVQINNPLDMNFNKILNVGDPIDERDAANKRYVDSFINVTVPADLYEVQTLASGQTVVEFSSPIIKGVFYLSGDDTDNGRLVEGVDYTANATTQRITLTQSHPAGTRVILVGVSHVEVDDKTILSFATLDDLRNTEMHTVYSSAYLEQEGRAGMFVWNSSDLNTEVAADTQSGIYVAPTSDLTGASGAWVRQYEGAVNVKWFGAVGDGVTDDATSLQAWLNTADSLCMPEGFFNSSLPLTVGSNTAVVGSGYNSCIVFTEQTGCRLLNSDRSGVTRNENISFDNLRVKNAGGTNDNDTGIDITGCVGVKLTRLYLQDGRGHGIYLRDVIDAVVDDIYCRDQEEQGVAVTSGSNITINNVRGEGNLITLVDIEPNAGDIITDLTVSNVIFNEPTHAVALLGYAHSIKNAAVSNIIGSTVVFNGVDGLTVGGVVLKGSSSVMASIFYQCANVLCNGVTVYDSAQVGITKFKLSAIEDAVFSDISLKGSGAGAYTIDLLELDNVTLNNISTDNAGTYGARLRNSRVVNINNVLLDGASYGMLLSPSTANSDISITGLRTPNCGTGFDMSGTNSNIYLDGDLSGATTPINVHGLAAGVVTLGNLRGVRGVYWGTAAPTAGTYKQGEITYHSTPASGGNAGWICTAGGTPGTWKSFGTIE